VTVFTNIFRGGGGWFNAIEIGGGIEGELGMKTRSLTLQ